MSLVSLLRCSCIHWVQIWAPPAPLVQAIQSLNVSVTLSSSIHRSNVMLRILLMNSGQLSTGLNNKFLNKSLTLDEPPDDFCHNFQYPLSATLATSPVWQALLPASCGCVLRLVACRELTEEWLLRG